MSTFLRRISYASAAIAVAFGLLGDKDKVESLGILVDSIDAECVSSGYAFSDGDYASAHGGVRISSIEKSASTISLVVECLAESEAHVNVHLYSSPILSFPGWRRLSDIEFGSSPSTNIVSVSADANGGSAFFTLGSDADSDCDGVPDSDERLIYKTNHLEPDTDGDGLSDGWEIAHYASGFNPKEPVSSGAYASAGDLDGDGLSNAEEAMLGTEPANDDTDGDGIRDGEEIPVEKMNAAIERLQMQIAMKLLFGQMPDPWYEIPELAGCTNPCSTNNAAYAAVGLYFGDPSASHSEKYFVEASPVAGTGRGDEPETITFLNGQYGVCDLAIAFLRRGWSYEVKMRQASIDFSKVEEPDPDYALIGAGAAGVVFHEDPQGLFGVSDVTNGVYRGAGKTATMTVYDVDVSICSPDDGDWTELEEARVVLDDELLKIKISIWPAIGSLSEAKTKLGGSFRIATSGTLPAGVSIDIGENAEFVQVGNASEVRIALTRNDLVSHGLLPAQNEDGVDEMASYDSGSDTVGQGTGESDTSDSKAFLSVFSSDTTDPPPETLEALPRALRPHGRQTGHRRAISTHGWMPMRKTRHGTPVRLSKMKNMYISREFLAVQL